MINFGLATQQEIRKELAERLRTQRLAQGLPQEDVAGRAGVSISTLKRLEKSGSGSFEAVIRVALALGLASELQSLFTLRIQSIAQMEQVEHAKRYRAPRQRKPVAPDDVLP
jgi:transcriptional regulator with XRE-family HTH domain